MDTEAKTYIAIDLKSFYASSECADRHLNALNTHLVVADLSRTEKTICLAVSPSLKAYGIPGRARLFEVVQKVREINRQRLLRAPGRRFSGKSSNAAELAADPSLELDYIVAKPRMARYIEVSSKIYGIYIRFAAPEDIHVYSIDEVFIDATVYLKLYGTTAHALARKIIREILRETGITATAGIAENLFLCKVAMDIVAKHIPADADGVRIAELDEAAYRRTLWDHEPLTDFWRVGRGYAERLAAYGIRTMGDIARISVRNEEFLYRMFGVAAELLIDHAWGWEPCTIADIKAYRPQTRCLCSGQVLQEPYTFDRARVVMTEMADRLALDLVEKRSVTDKLTLTVGYDTSNLTDPERRRAYSGPITEDRYGRAAPKAAHGTVNLSRQTASSRLLRAAALELFDRAVHPALLVRRLTLTAERIVGEDAAAAVPPQARQLDLFTDYEALERREKAEAAALEKEKRLQQAILGIQRTFGKNALLKGTDFLDGATGRERNEQIGGHHR